MTGSSTQGSKTVLHPVSGPAHRAASGPVSADPIGPDRELARDGRWLTDASAGRGPAQQMETR
jgi:hypothetical protein